MNQADRDRIEDLGLNPEADLTEDLRPRRNECAPGRCANTAEGDQNDPTAK